MSNSELPKDLLNSAQSLHSTAIHLLRRARVSDKETGLTPERLSLLSILVFVGAKTINQLATMEQVSAPAISRIVKSLQQDQWVIRARSKQDSRIVYVSATNKAKIMLRQAQQARVEYIAQELLCLSEQEREALDVIMGKLNAQSR